MMIKKRRITVLDHLAFPVRNHTQSKEELSKKKRSLRKKKEEPPKEKEEELFSITSSFSFS
jgi:hypothetical protein